MIIHIVGFRFKDTVTEEQRKDVSRKLLSLADASGVIKAVSGGLEKSPEGKGKGYHQIYTLKFQRWEDLHFYQNYDHAHQIFNSETGQLSEDVLVWDYEDFQF
ncbi:hypothetical protein E3Q15_03010 [Wallemia mellicola]|nr:hypothetical protein E3Q15_03010 [Wallemia mellicola]TIC52729.1 hypothetical protein E3Q05_02635 [Wallemia mellicola]